MQPLDDLHFPARVKNCAARLAQRGSGALAELFDLTASRAVRFARTITRDTHDAEDALQAAFVRVTVNPRVLADAWHPWAYLLRIVRNEALKIAGRKRVDQFISLVSEIGCDAPATDSESRELVQLALARLPASQSEVVVLKIWEGMTFAEISEVLGESPNTAASRYRYALEKLTRALQPLVETTRVSHDERTVPVS